MNIELLSTVAVIAPDPPRQSQAVRRCARAATREPMERLSGDTGAQASRLIRRRRRLLRGSGQAPRRRPG